MSRDRLIQELRGLGVPVDLLRAVGDLIDFLEDPEMISAVTGGQE